MREYKYSGKAFKLFFVLVIVGSGIAETLYCLGGPGWLVLLLMWIPGISGILASIVSIREKGEHFTLRKHHDNLGFHFSKLRYVFMGILLPLIYLLIPYMIYWKRNPENFAYSGVAIGLILKDCLPITIIGIFVSLLSALGEEIGWRGFMVPALNERTGLNKMLVITSIFWCCWHLPLLIFGDYMSGTTLLYQVPAFILCIFPVGIMTALLTLESRSVWPAAFLHAAHNNYDQAVLGLITRGDDRMYYVSETGVFTIICAWILAILMLMRYRRKNAVNETEDR